MKHVIKIHPIYFDQVIKGIKKAELRVNDRGYEQGDTVEMLEWCPDKNDYTGNKCKIQITCINDVSKFTKIDNQVMFSFVLKEVELC